MGGLLRAPKVPTAPAPAPAPTAAAVPAPAPVVAVAEPAQPAVDPGAAARRRGLAGTIATSDRGLVDDSRIIPSRKTLLGE
jgi:hypothetical protein